MTLADQVIKNIVSRVIRSQDYRIEIVGLLDAEFLQFCSGFLKRIAAAKSKDASAGWYEDALMDTSLSSADFAIHSGLNMKTIQNMYGSEAKSVVEKAGREHFKTLREEIRLLAANESRLNLMTKVSFDGMDVDLDFYESLLVINALSVKRAALRGGLWSTAGKRAEKFLMLALCRLYEVDKRYYNAEHFKRNRELDVDREIDFYFLNGENRYKCEVKLMGKGNPESADAIIARQSRVFVADTLSLQNKRQCEQLGISWVACRDEEGFRKFGSVLEELDIPHTDYRGDLDADLPDVLEEVFAEYSGLDIPCEAAK